MCVWLDHLVFAHLLKVDGLVCVVGEDMDLKQTAVGQAILKTYPQVAQVCNNTSSGACMDNL